MTQHKDVDRKGHPLDRRRRKKGIRDTERQWLRTQREDVNESLEGDFNLILGGIRK